MKDSEEFNARWKSGLNTLKIMAEERNRDIKKRSELLKLDKKPFADYSKMLLIYLVLYGLMFWWLLYAIFHRADI